MIVTKIREIHFKKVSLETSKECCTISNRHALILKYKQPFISWEKKQNPWRDSDPEHNSKIAPARISLFIKKKNESNEDWLKKNFRFLFEG